MATSVVLSWPSSALAQRAELQLLRVGCTPDGWSDEGFVRVLRAELRVTRVELAVEHGMDGSVELALQCDDTGPSALVTVQLHGPRTGTRTVALAELEPSVWVRAVALTAHELVVAILEEPPPQATPPPTARGPSAALELGSRVLVFPRTPTAGGGVLAGLSLRPEGLPIEGFAELAFAYVEHRTASNDVAATSTDVRLGARLLLDVPPLRLGAELAVVGSHLWIAGGAGARGRTERDAFAFAIDLAARIEVALAHPVSLALSVGARAYLVGVDAHLSGAPGVGFVEAIPIASLSLVVLL